MNQTATGCAIPWALPYYRDSGFELLRCGNRKCQEPPRLLAVGSGQRCACGKRLGPAPELEPDAVAAIGRLVCAQQAARMLVEANRCAARRRFYQLVRAGQVPRLLVPAADARRIRAQLEARRQRLTRPATAAAELLEVTP